MGACCSCCRQRKPRDPEREPLLPQYAPKVPSQSSFDKVAEIIAAVSVGKLPSQQQLNIVVQALLRSEFLRTEQLSVNGPLSAASRQLVDDVRDVLQALLVIGMEKNNDDRLQDLIWHTTQISEMPVDLDVAVDTDVSLGLEAGASKLPSEPLIDKDEITRDAQLAAKSIKTLITLLFTSNAFRLLIYDVMVLTREIIADTVADVAKLAAAVEIKAEQVEEVIRPDGAEIAHEKDKDADNVAPPSLEELANIGRDARHEVSDALHETKEEFEHRQERIREKLNDEHPKRTREQVLHRVEQIVEQAQSDPRFTTALRTLSELVQKWIRQLAHNAQIVNEAAKATASDAHASTSVQPMIDIDPNLSKVLEDAKALLERFAGHGLDLFAERLMRTLSDIGNSNADGYGENRGVQALLKSWGEWLNKALDTPGYVATEESRSELNRLYDWFIEIWEENPTWKVDARGTVDEAEAFIDGLRNDKATSRFVMALSKLTDDFTELGRTGVQVATRESWTKWNELKQELKSDVLQWLLPRLLRALGTIPLPRVELKSPSLDLVIDKLTLSSPSFIPDHIRITSFSDVLLSASDATDDGSLRAQSRSRTKIRIDGLRISADTIAYYVNAKGPLYTGWLDNGLLTVDIGERGEPGDGVAIEVELEMATSGADGVASRTNETHDAFKVIEAKVDVPGLQFTFENTRHWIFNSLFTQPLGGPLVRAGLSLALSSQVRSLLEGLNKKLVGVKEAVREKQEPTLWDYVWAMFGSKDESNARKNRERFRRSEAPSPTSSRFPSPSPTESEDTATATATTHTHVTTEPTAKGIIRTTVTENEEGEPISETVLAVGIGEQILPGLGGPENGEPAPPTFTEQGREALNEIDNVRKEVKKEVASTKDVVEDRADVMRQRAGKAAERASKVRKSEAKKRDSDGDNGWRSDVFDL